MILSEKLKNEVVPVPLRDFGSCTPNPIGVRRVVSEGEISCPRAGCGKFSGPVR